MVRSGEQQLNISVRMFHDEDAYQRCSQIVLGTNLKSNIQFWQITPYNTTIKEVNYENC